MLTKPTDVSRKKDDHRGMVYVGKVEDNADPLQLKRVRVSIPELLEGSGEELPWAIPQCADYSSMNVPAVGTPVYCEFQNGDLHYPMYKGEHTSVGNAIPGNLSGDYPNRYGFSFPGGHFWINKETGEMEFQQAGGTFLRISAGGDIESNAANWDHTGNITMTGNFTLTGELMVTGNITSTMTITGLAVIGTTVQGITQVSIGDVLFTEHVHYASPDNTGTFTGTPPPI